MKKYNKSKYQTYTRKTVSYGNGTIITISGTNCCEWTVSAVRKGNVEITTFPNRVMADKEFRRLKKVYK